MFRRILILIVLLFALAAVGQAQQVNPNIRVVGINTESCTPGQLCVATGFNWLIGQAPGSGWASGVVVQVWSIMPDGSQVAALNVVPNSFRINFYPRLGTEGAVGFRFKGAFYDFQTTPLTVPTPTFAPVLFARGSFCYSRPSPGACESFSGVLTFPSSVGIISLTLEAAGIGAFSGEWTAVLTDSLSSETETFAREFAATAYPAGNGLYTDVVKFDIGFPPSGSYFLYVFRFAENGTLIRSPRVAITIQ